MFHFLRDRTTTAKRACKRSGLPDDITSRVFRRTGATNWDGDVKDLAAQGGWKDVKTARDPFLA
jgi:hypothetical protein